MSNTGGAWDNTKKYIESGRFFDKNGNKQGKGSD
jgi:Na+/H+-translocating membrane pyrophosphatase